jgi:hypothetical protein
MSPESVAIPGDTLSAVTKAGGKLEGSNHSGECLYRSRTRPSQPRIHTPCESGEPRSLFDKSE